MKILIDLTSLADNFSGIERYAKEISLQMLENDEHQFILVFKEKTDEDFAVYLNKPNVSGVVLKRCNKLLFNQWRLWKYLKKVHADIFFFPAFPAPNLLRKKNIAATVHDLCCWDCPETMSTKSKWYFRVGIRNEVKKSKIIYTVSEFSKNRLIEKFGLSEDKIQVAYNGISDSFKNIVSDFKNNEKINQKYSLPDKYILSLSTIEPRKNIALLLTAYQDLVKSGHDICDLVLAGRDGWKNSTLMDGIEDEVKQRIHFTGFIEEEDLPYIYNKAELFVFPSNYEGFGLPPLEAMACRTVVISSDSASLPEVLGDAALYFEKGNKSALCDAIIAGLSLDNKDEYITKGKEISARYSWKESAELILKTLT